MKVSRTIPLAALLLVVACAGPATEPEPADESAPAAVPQLTPDEQVAEMEQGCAEAAAAMEQRQADEPLYERLGGREGIRAFVVEMLRLHRENPDVAPFFESVDTETFIENATDFIAAGTGGSEEYTGGEVTAVHAEMNLTNADFLAAGGDIEAAMANLGIGPDEQQEILCSLVSMRSMVIASAAQPGPGGAEAAEDAH